MAEKIYTPTRQKLKYFLPLLVLLSLLSFSSLVYSSCPVFVQCSPEEITTNPVCTQACSMNFNVLLFIVLAIVSYLVPSTILHHRNR